VLQLAVHLVDRPRGFAEARRVLAPGGRIVIATFEPEHFGRFWLNRFLPSVEAIDRARFPTREQLAAELLAAGFATLRLTSLHQEVWLDREDALAAARAPHLHVRPDRRGR